MNRLALAALMLAASPAYVQPAHAQPAGGSAPVCPDPTLPDCVLSNWGQVDPDGITAMIAPRPDGQAGTDTTSPGIRMAVGAPAKPASPSVESATPANAIKTIVSPVGLFKKETAALISAVKRARFRMDGSIASGEAAIAEAAAIVARKAGNKYALTLYIKAPRTLQPEDSAQLEKKVRTINGVLVAAVSGANGKQ